MGRQTLSSICFYTRTLWKRPELSWILLITAAIYIAHYLFGQWPTVLEAMSQFTLMQVICGAACITLMVWLKATYHAICLRPLGIKVSTRSSLRHLTSIYAQSQIARYVPGKIFGVAFEANRLGREFSLPTIVFINLTQMLHTQLATLGIMLVAALWLLNFRSEALLICSVFAFTLLWASHYWHLPLKLLTFLTTRYTNFTSTQTRATSNLWRSLLLTLILVLEWLPYFAYWIIILSNLAIPPQKVILLGMVYAASALASALVLVVPSGLLVREALFLWAGSQLLIDPALLILLGVFSRILFCVADIALIPLTFAVNKPAKR